MKHILWGFVFMTSVIAWSQAVKTDSLPSKKFGLLKIYKPENPKEIVLFISGDAGWKYGVIDMAKALANNGALVIGIDILKYWKSVQKSTDKCVYLSEDFEALSKYIQAKYQFKTFHKPILVGYSSGATLVYGLLAEAPNYTYKGAIGLGFCPDFKTKKQICVGSGLRIKPLPKIDTYNMLPRKNMTTHFKVLMGALDQTCQVDSTKIFLSNLPNYKIYQLDKVGHGFSHQKDWMPQFLEAYNDLVKIPKLTALRFEYPIHEIAVDSTSDTPLVLSISGDGGWKGYIDNLSLDLGQYGWPTVGIDALSYFWDSKTPQQTAADISNILSYYLNKWHKTSYILLGYSFGADVLPFIANKLPDDLRDNLGMMILLSPDNYADFEFHFTSWLDHTNSEHYKVLPQLKTIQDVPILALYGQEETDRINFIEAIKNIQIINVKGDHHYNYNHKGMAELIYKSWLESQNKKP